MEYVITVLEYDGDLSPHSEVVQLIGPFGSDAEAHMYASDHHLLFNVMPLERPEGKGS